jgi:hypothetical protein
LRPSSGGTTSKGNSWTRDRHRVVAVGRYLGLLAKSYAEDSPTIGIEPASKASADVERGCQMNARREAFSGGAVPI